MAYQYENPNPLGKKIGDCVIRALALAEDMSWAEVYRDLAVLGMEMCDMPSSNGVWGKWLKDHGYRRKAIPNTCPDCYTIADFAEEHKNGTYVVGTGSHVVTTKQGSYLDAWDSGSEVPIFYFYKEA